jgi:(p)ppGpp synthase/HD superfamily hydrolase
MASRIDRARKFAEHAHRSVNHRRKYTGEAYITHPAAVAELVAGVTRDEATICAAWLHDVIEDTPVTLDMIGKEFGNRVERLVAQLTDISKPEDGNRTTRKKIDREHIRQACAQAKTVKLADLIDNAGSITKYDPQFARIYMEEKRLLLEVLKEGDQTLYRMAEAIISNYFAS